MSFRNFRKHSSKRAAAAGAMVIATAMIMATGVACTPDDPASDSETDTSTGTSSGVEIFPASEINPLLEGIVHKTPKELPTTRLADGLIPPTNQWFSGLVFGDEAQPVFPLPLSFGLTESGFAFGIPDVTTTEKTIMGGFKPDVTVDTGAASAQVTDYDEATVTIAGLDGEGDVLGHTTIAEGSPYVTYTAESGGTVSTGTEFAKTGDFWTVQAGEVTYGLVTDGSVSGASLELDEGNTATFFVVPADGSADKLAALAAEPVTGSSLDYEVTEEKVTTTITYETEGDTAFATMPHQQQDRGSAATCDLGTYPSVYGTMELCSARSSAGLHRCRSRQARSTWTTSPATSARP
jgi:endo-1,3(4)-beta-glucanase